MAAPEISTSRQVRALFTDRDITVYQSYEAQIADAAVAAGTFVAPFKRRRMTWIKPSFLWMMYRSGWAMKPGQERILAISITRDGFEWALAHSVLSHYEPRTHASKRQWTEQKITSPVRVQWDPDRSLRLAPLSSRAIQIGLSGEAVDLYLDQWITSITDITATVHQIRALVAADDCSTAETLLPPERPYDLPGRIRNLVGIA